MSRTEKDSRIFINNPDKRFSARKWKLEKKENAKLFQEQVLEAMNNYDDRIKAMKGDEE